MAQAFGRKGDCDKLSIGVASKFRSDCTEIDMPQCIYCMIDKPLQGFDPEHVFSRGLCGPGANWTLLQEVCRKCNSRFSAYEAHWMRQTIEATARNFYGLEGRSEKQRFDRTQPVEIDNLYILNKGDSTVYEAGFAFPADHHFRPQIVWLPSGLFCLATNPEDEKALRAALDALSWRSIAVTIPLWQKRHANWLIAEIDAKPGRGFVITDYKKEGKPRGLWLRSFPHSGMMARNRLVDTDHVLSTRMALDHRGRLYFRAANIDAIPPFLNDLFQSRFTCDPPPNQVAGNQTVVFGLALDLVKIYQAVLKNGFNLFTYFYGAEAAKSLEFSTLRRMLIDDPTDRKLVMQHCQMYDEGPSDFPKSGNPREHRMLLSLNSEGVVHFRMRLFDALGYEALLGLLPASLISIFQTRRVKVDFVENGISEIQDWS